LWTWINWLKLPTYGRLLWIGRWVMEIHTIQENVVGSWVTIVFSVMTPVHEVNLAAPPLIGECVLSGAFQRSFRIAFCYLFIRHLELDVQPVITSSNCMIQNQNIILHLLHFLSWIFWFCNWFQWIENFCVYEKETYLLHHEDSS
jgi:hypothetical protein